MRAPALACLLLLLGAAAPGFAQQRDVRIDISSGQGRRIRVHCESLAAAGDKNAHETSVQADEVLANDLETSAVFTVTRSWASGEQPFDVQAVVGGKWTANGNQIKLSGEVRDFPARRPILVKDYRGAARDWRSMAITMACRAATTPSATPKVSSASSATPTVTATSISPTSVCLLRRSI